MRLFGHCRGALPEQAEFDETPSAVNRNTARAFAVCDFLRLVSLIGAYKFMLCADEALFRAESGVT